MSIKIGGRSGGKSATAAAAYRAGDEVRDAERGRVYDYTAKRGVVHSEILLPEHAPQAWRDRAELWNAVEERERASNSQLYREFEIALPRELPRGEQLELVRDWIKAELVARAACVRTSPYTTATTATRTRIYYARRDRLTRAVSGEPKK